MVDAAPRGVGVVVLVVGLAFAGAVAGAAVPQPHLGAAGVDDGEDAVADAHAAEPTLSVPESVNRSSNLTATVSLPSSADGTERFVVRLERVSGGTVANRTLSLAPGETATVDFGACLATANYLVQVATPAGDVLVADQVQVARATPLVALGDDDALRESFEPTVTRDETLTVTARLHPCVDRATVSLSPRDEGVDARWRVTVVDADDDGRVAFDWDVDAPRDSWLAAADGTEFAAVDGNRDGDAPVPYGAYDLRTTTSDGESRSGRVTVSFANPRATVYIADGALDATDAIAAARDDDPVDDEYRVRVADSEWVVLRFDTDGTLDSLPDDAELVAPARHENVTVRVQGIYGTMDQDGPTVDLANATRRFDPESGTLWYAYRANAGNEPTRFEYAAIGADWNATVATEVSGVDPVRMGVEHGDLLAPERVVLDGDAAYADGTALNVSVRANDRVLATDSVAVEDGTFDARLDLSGVANGTNASLVVRTDERVVHQRAVVVASKPVLVLHETDTLDDLAADEPVTVHAFVLNRGTAAGNATVSVSLGAVTRERTVSVPAGEDAVVEVRFPASDVPDGGEVPVVVSMGDQRVQRTASIDAPTTTLPTTTSSTTPTGTEPWPTLAGGERRPANDPIPGFGLLAALSAVAAALVLVARRVSPTADADGD